MLRTLHWVTASIFILNYWVLEPGGDWHQYLGYAMTCVVLTRVLWGLLGPANARFSLQALGRAHWREHVRELRARAQARLGERFKLREYHDQLMAAGAVTLPVLEEAVDDWLARHAA